MGESDFFDLTRQSSGRGESLLCLTPSVPLALWDGPVLAVFWKTSTRTAANSNHDGSGGDLGPKSLEKQENLWPSKSTVMENSCGHVGPNPWNAKQQGVIAAGPDPLKKEMGRNVWEVKKL